MCVHFVLEGMHQHMRDRTTLHTLSSQAALVLAVLLKVLVFLVKSGSPCRRGSGRGSGGQRQGVEEGGGGGAETGHPAWNLCLFLAAAPLEQDLHCLKHTFQVCNVKILSA